MVNNSSVVYVSNDSRIQTKSKKENNRSVVLTFDDGPSRSLDRILDILHEEDVQVMFFWQSRLLYPERPWQRVLDEGHRIGTHSSKHLNLASLSFEEQYDDIAKSVKKIEAVTNERIEYLRPPFGQYNEDTIKAAELLGLQVVQWRVASMDWELKDQPELIIDNVVDHLEDGAIILLHELRQTVAVLPELIRKIRAAGYTFSLL